MGPRRRKTDSKLDCQPLIQYDRDLLSLSTLIQHHLRGFHVSSVRTNMVRDYPH